MARENVKQDPRLIDSLAPDEIVVDLFCGGGGASAGVKAAGLDVFACVNHSPLAIAWHERNFPETRHYKGDVWKAKPERVSEGRPVGLLWASPDCRHFSRARGAAPVSRRVRDLAWVAVKWAQSQAAPRVIIIENVAEFLTWGPVSFKRDGRGRIERDAQGRALMVPNPKRVGETFRRWRRMLERAGYVVDHRVCDAADFGAASRRKRLFVIARRDGQPIVWPEKTHGLPNRRAVSEDAAGSRGQPHRKRKGRDFADREQDQKPAPQGFASAESSDAQAARRGLVVRDQDRQLREHRAAAEIIDWSDLGTSIFERSRPLKEKTLKRIAEGVRRYVLNDPAPFVLRVTHGEGRGWKVHGIDEPLPTQTTRQDLAVCTPVVQLHRGEVMGKSAGEPLPTITAGGHALGIATPILTQSGYGERVGQAARVHRVSELLGTSVAGGVKQALVSPLFMSAGGPECRAVPGSEPLGTVLPRDHRALVAPVMAYLNHGGKQTGDAREPLRTVMAGGTHAALVGALLVKFYGQERGGHGVRDPLGTVTTIDRHGLVCVVIDGAEFVMVDILFRMLQPRELASAMGFAPEYQLPAVKRDAVRLIGNAVAPPMAEALVRAVLPGGRREGRAVA